MKKRALQWLSILLVFTLLVGCGSASNYIKDNYSLVDVQGQGKTTAKIYSVEGKNVPAVAKELADNEKPQEVSKESEDQMFLVYDDKIINLQKDPSNANNTLVELDSIEYAKQNYDSSFLQGYVAASLLQSLFGGGWFNNNRGAGYDYRGYTSTKRYDDYGKYQTVPSPSGSGTTTKPSTPAPSTTERKGSFSSSPSKTTTPATPTAPSSDSSTSRKSDGSTPTYKTPSKSSSGSKPSTSTRSGSFKKK